MRSRIIVTAVSVVAVAGFALLYLRFDEETLPAQVSSTPSSPTLVASSISQLSNATPMLLSENERAASDATSIEQTASDKFRIDASGQLVLNEQTRLHVEALVALTDPSQLDMKTEDEVRDFPPAARARAHDLVERYRVYIIAQKEAYPPGASPNNEDEMATQLDGLHALRVAHFGQATADAFYAEEEKLDRELLDLMRLEKDPGLTMEEKAERAQARYTMLHLAAKNN